MILKSLIQYAELLFKTGKFMTILSQKAVPYKIGSYVPTSKTKKY
jgi:hypothetical protein